MYHTVETLCDKNLKVKDEFQKLITRFTEDSIQSYKILSTVQDINKNIKRWMFHFHYEIFIVPDKICDRFCPTRRALRCYVTR